MRRWLPALLVFGACSPFTTDATSGGDHSETDASVADAGVDGRGPSSPADVEAPEASGIVIANAFCNSNPPLPTTVLCEDFENAALASKWSKTPPGPYFAHFIDPASKGGAGRYTIATKSPAWVDTGNARDAFGRSVTLNAGERHRVEIAFDLYLAAVPTSMNVEISSLNVGPYNYHLNIKRPDTEDEGVADLQLGEFTTSDEQSVIANMSTHAWHRIVFALESGKGSASTFEVTIDAALAKSGVVGRGQENAIVSTVTVTAGMTYIQDLTGTMDYFLDNIVVSDKTL